MRLEGLKQSSEVQKLRSLDKKKDLAKDSTRDRRKISIIL